MNDPTHPPYRQMLVPAEPDQGAPVLAGQAPFVLLSGADVAALERFRARPDVLIGGGEHGTWQALITEDNGETVVVRHTLRELVARLGELLGEPPQ